MMPPMMPPQGMPPGMSSPEANQGMPPGMMACPCCGQPMISPDQSAMAPNMPLPAAQMGMGANGAPPDSELLEALMGGGQMGMTQ